MPRGRPIDSAPPIRPSTLYAGPPIPIEYDQNWQLYTNLTKDQIAWFQAQPEWNNFLAYVALSPATASAATPISVVNSALLQQQKIIAGNG